MPNIWGLLKMDVIIRIALLAIGVLGQTWFVNRGYSPDLFQTGFFGMRGFIFAVILSFVSMTINWAILFAPVLLIKKHLLKHRNSLLWALLILTILILVYLFIIVLLEGKLTVLWLIPATASYRIIRFNSKFERMSFEGK